MSAQPHEFALSSLVYSENENAQSVVSRSSTHTLNPVQGQDDQGGQQLDELDAFLMVLTTEIVPWWIQQLECMGISHPDQIRNLLHVSYTI